MAYKLITKGTKILVKDGRKIAAKVATSTLTPNAQAGLIAGADVELPLEELVAALEAAVAEALSRKASIVPDEYRYKYGADQNCGDDVALRLTAKVTDPKTGVNLEACREVAGANGIEDRFDAWLARDLNPGMVRMNLGNVLRGKVRRGEEVLGL